MSRKKQKAREGLEFTSHGDGTCYLSRIGTYSNASSIVIPKFSPDGDVVTGIFIDASKSYETVKTIVIPDSITLASKYSFSAFSAVQFNSYDNAEYVGTETNPYFLLVTAKDNSIASCKIHPDTQVIAQDAFYDCSSLQYNSFNNIEYLGTVDNPVFALIKVSDHSIVSCEIPSYTKIIDTRDFFSCELLKDIVVSEENANYCSIDGVLYNKPTTQILCVPKAIEGSVRVPYGITHIYSSFSERTFLSSVRIPDGVISIGENSFYQCSSLASISIPNSVVEIGEFAFFGCKSLTEIELPNKIAQIGNYAFEHCKEITNIVIPNSVVNIGREVFCGCYSLTTVTIPDSMTNIGGYAFAYCDSLTNITYKGTQTQWDAINKVEKWNLDTGSYTIHCTDGDIAK